MRPVALVVVGLFGLTALANEFAASKIEPVARPIAPDPIPIPKPPPPPCCQEGAIQSLMRRLHLGRPVTCGGLTVFPIRRSDARGIQVSVMTLSDATSRGCLRVSERGYAAVDSLTVSSRCGAFVFLMGGELVSGGRQDRFIAHDGLLAPWQGAVEVPVYCSEQGRWAGMSDSFQSGAVLASPFLRSRLREGASQEEVWEKVREEVRRLDVETATGRYGAVKNAAPMRRLEGACSRLRRRMQSRRIVGAIFVRSGRVLGGDLFATHDLFASLLPALTASYSLRSGGDCCDASAFLSGFLHLSFTSPLPTFGAGRRLRFRGASGSGEALLYRGSVIHAVLSP